MDQREKINNKGDKSKGGEMRRLAMGRRIKE